MFQFWELFLLEFQPEPLPDPELLPDRLEPVPLPLDVLADVLPNLLGVLVCVPYLPGVLLLEPEVDELELLLEPDR